MSEEPKNHQAWWEKGKRLVLLTQVAQTLILLGGFLYGTYVIVRNEVAEILAVPKRTAIIAHKQDSSFAAYDSLHAKQFFVQGKSSKGF